MRLLFLVIANVTCSYAHSVLLIKDCIKHNYLTNILLVACQKQYEEISIEILTLQHQGSWINVWDISKESLFIDFDYDKFFLRLNHPLLVVVDLDCNQTSAFMTQMSKRILFHYERNWLMFGSNIDRSFDILSRQNINFDADITLAIPVTGNDDKDSSYDIYEVFNPSSNRDGRLNITQLGQWSTTSGLHIPLKQTKIERRGNLQGITFPAVVTLRNLPNNTTYLEHLNSNYFQHLNSVSRLNYRLFLLIMDMYNFNVHIRVASLWASLDTQGKWYGAIGLVNQSEVDFCLTALRWENDRYGVIEHTTHSYHVQVLFIFRHPKSVEAANVFLSPFKGIVWCAIVGLTLLSANVVRKILSTENHKRLKNKERVNDDSYSNSILMIFGFIFQQSYSGNLFLTSSRILTITMLVFSLLIFQFYSSFIVGSLLIETPKHIKTIKQLMNSRLTFGQDEVPYVIDNFFYAKEASTVQLYDKMMKNPGKVLMPVQTGLNLLKKGGFAFNTDGSYAYIILKNTLTDSEKCELQEVKYVQKVPAGPVLPNKSAYRELIKISIRKITETGLLSYYNKMFYGTKPKCEISQVIVASVDILHFSSALYFLIIGILSSTIILIIEVVVSKCSRHKRCSENRMRK